MKRLGPIADRLAKGSSILSVRLARGTVAWLTAGEKISDFVVRLIFLGIPVVVVWSLLRLSLAFMWVLAALWCIAAYRAAQPAKPSAPPPPAAPAPSRPKEAGHETPPGSGGGVRVISTPDPDNPARTHVRVVESGEVES